MEKQIQKDKDMVKYMKNAFSIMKDSHGQDVEELKKLLKDRRDLIWQLWFTKERLV